MNARRIARHLLSSPWRARRAFPRSTLQAIELAVAESERSHDAELRFAVEGALHGTRLLRGQSPRERALELFSLLRMWDTEHRNAVLIYVLLADRSVEIVADRGAHARIDSAAWHQVCGEMQSAFARGDYRGGAVNGIHAVASHLGKHFPSRSGANQLQDKPLVL
ncbi:MAG: TPM domain-containing protein [Steroidobacteraceae bacterium]